ncbi:SpoIIE family protein phosphatase [Actinomadura flavalba]|uniref:SpoIIE family protein phosphatase n=1 Tax=Actinomadura flavalba TaxID=1120938 RepID=UPI00037CC957|nr:SpoIIE family protein phosphatase [Actinomadura flavalba]
MTNIASATRRGVRPHNADAAASFTAADGTTAAVVIDGIGNSGHLADTMRLVAAAVARVAAQRGGLAGLMTGHQMIASPDADGWAPDGVAVVAIDHGDGDPVDIYWIGDAVAYGWDGKELVQATTVHTMGQFLRHNGAPLELAAEHDNWVRTTLRRATPATICQAEISAWQTILLTSDGVPDGLPDGAFERLLRDHGDGEPQALADALVAAVEPDADEYRDDATVIVLTP